MSNSRLRLILALAAFASATHVSAQTKKVVRSVNDLPQSSYAISGSVADVLRSSPEVFAATVAPILADIDRILGSYDINDNATLRTLLSARLGTEIASGKEDKKALSTILEIRAHQDKDEARLISGLAPQSFLEARLADGTKPGSCPHDFAAIYAKHLDTLPWAVVGAAETQLKGMAMIANASFMIGVISPELQPTLDRSHALSSYPSWHLLAARTNMDVIVPCHAEIAADTDAYVHRHSVKKSDIWAAREAILPETAVLSPVRVAIWDSGFDASLFPGQLLLSEDGQPVLGPTYDVDYQPSQEPLAPLSAEDKTAYPQIVADGNGISDLKVGIDSPAAVAVRKRFAAMSSGQMDHFMRQSDVLESYMHGTHVAGIAARDNPSIRMVSARVTYDTKSIPTPPTDDSQRRIAAADRDTVAWFRAHGIRVVNMSWWNSPSTYESNLEKNVIGKTAEERKALARHYFNIERDGLYAALKSAPEILFVTIAGNNDSDNAFDETIPSSFRLPNLLVVGAVDQAGQQTNFTSTGKNILVYADGYEVESVVPGGAKVRMSGTSMAAPEVTNLASKLLAVDATLTPAQLVAIILRTADAGETPTIRRINPRLALKTLVAKADSHTATR